MPGVYVIRFGNRAYSGGSLRVYERVADHLRSLALGEHENPAVQAVHDESCSFKLTIRRMPGASEADVLAAERKTMGHLLTTGAALLNHNIPHRADDYDGRFATSTAGREAVARRRRA